MIAAEEKLWESKLILNNLFKIFAWMLLIKKLLVLLTDTVIDPNVNIMINIIFKNASKDD